MPTTSDAVIVDAIQRPGCYRCYQLSGYWIGKHKSVKYLDDLLLQMATTILVNHDTGLYTGNPQEALDALVKYGVINTRDYWAANMGKLRVHFGLDLQGSQCAAGNHSVRGNTHGYHSYRPYLGNQLHGRHRADCVYRP